MQHQQGDRRTEDNHLYDLFIQDRQVFHWGGIAETITEGTDGLAVIL